MEPNDNKLTQDIVSNYEWLIRPCELYKEEYKDCRSFKARFNQYFIYGELQDCTPWKKDHENCVRLVENNDEKSKINLIESEYARRMARLRAHRNNNTWNRRAEPPTDWSKPLPEWIIERDKNSYLDIKARELNGEDMTHADVSMKTSCTIL